LVVVLGSVEDGEDGVLPHGSASLPGDADWGETGVTDTPSRENAGRPHIQRACLMRAVNSCTRLYTERSSRISRAILDVAWMTVVWSRPPNWRPILGSDESVSPPRGDIAAWRGERT